MRMRRDFLRRQWRVFTVFGVLGIALTAVAMPAAPHPVDWVLVGAIPTLVIALATHLVIVLSGSSYLLVAEQGEQWTRQVLEPMRRRRGWRVMHEVLLGRDGDIDHVIVGDIGLVVIETKWSIPTRSAQSQRDWEAKVAWRLNGHAARMATVLQNEIGRRQAKAFVVIWPVDSAFDAHDVDGVRFVSGHQLADELAALSPVGVKPEQIDVAWRVIEKQVRGRDGYELARLGSPPKTVGELAWSSASMPLGILLAILVMGGLFQLDLVVALVAALVLAGVCTLALRFERVHQLAAGFVVGLGSIAIGVTGAEMIWALVD